MKQTRRLLRLLRLLCLCQQMTRLKSESWGTFDPTVTLTFWP